MPTPSPTVRWSATTLCALAWGLAGFDPIGGGIALLGALLLPLAVSGRAVPDGLRGAWLGIVWYSTALAWFPGAWARFAGDGAWAAFGALIGLQCAVPAIALATAGAVVGRTGARSAWWIVPLAWVAAGGLPVQPLPSGPGLHVIGLALLTWPAALLGASGLTAAMLAWGGISLRRPGLGSLILLAWAGVGSIVHALPRPTPLTRVAVVQPDTGAFESRQPSRDADRARRLLQLIDQHGGDVDWVATPEGAWPWDPGPPQSARRRQFDEVWRARPPTALGVTWEDSGPRNAVLAVHATILDSFDKRSLVPLAERRVAGVGRDRFQPGTGARVLDLAGLQVAPLICYEDVLPAARWEAALSGADVVLAATNDAWLGPRGAARHLAVTRLAAITLGRWVVRSASNGPSAVISPTGRVEVQTRWVDADGQPTAGDVFVADVPRSGPPWSGALADPWLPPAAGLVLLVAVMRLRTAGGDR